jgi:hypothetical protein
MYGTETATGTRTEINNKTKPETAQADKLFEKRV